MQTQSYSGIQDKQRYRNWN